MGEGFFILVGIGVWILLQVVILPKMGINT